MKPWYKSKTVWLNILALAIIALASSYINPVIFGSMVTLINIVLRFITKTSIVSYLFDEDKFKGIPFENRSYNEVHHYNH